jgi:signal transduction histidine kinase
LTTTLQTIAKAVVDNTNLAACVLTTTGEDSHPWSIRVSHGLPQAFIEASEQAIADGARMNMSAQVHQTRERVVMANWWDYIRREPSLQGLLPWAEQSLWESVVCVPLLTRTQIVGTSYFYFPPNAVLSEQVLNLFDAVANQVALTIENAFLLEQTRRAEQEARTLSEIAAVVADPEGSSLNQIAERVVELSEAVACAIYVFEVSDSRLQLAGAAGLPEGYNQTLNTLWQRGQRSAAVQAFEEQSVLVRERLRDDTLANPEYSELHPFLKTVTWQKAVFVPLSLGEKTLGTLVTYFHDDLVVTSTVIQFVQAIADQVVVAVENARLFLEIQNKAGLEERQKLARELHDSVSQALFSIALSARTARTLLKRGQAENALEPVEYTLSLAEAGIAEMRALIFELRPESLEQEGLKMALSKQAASVQARHQLQVKLELADEPNLNLKTKEALYRIAQEALHNIVKHASARVVEIRLQTQNQSLVLEIRDDGKGFDTLAAKPGHLGLHSMRERAQGIGASFEVESVIGQGTTIRLALPL